MSSDHLFSAAASAYRSYRPSYPDALFNRIFAAVPPPRHRAVDLGAGTGLSSLPLCAWFDEVIAVEPDPEMVSRLPQTSPRLSVRCESAEAHDEPAGSVDLVTAANALYWTDAPAVVAKVAVWLRAGGVLAAYRYGFPRAAGEAGGLIEEELAQRWNQFRHPRLLDEDYSRRIVAADRSWRDFTVETVANVVSLTPGALVGFLRSTSYGSAYQATLASGDTYWERLEAAVAASGDQVAVDFALELILATR